MLNRDEDTQTLSKLGLTNAEAKVYLALIKGGSSSVHEIAKKSNVARPDVYRTVSRLQELGLVKKIVSSPNEFCAIPIFDALSMLLQKRRKDQEELAGKADILIEKYNNPQNNSSKEKLNQFILIPEKETLIRERIRASETAKEEILLMIPLKKLEPILTNYYEAFDKAIKRKVRYQIITEKNGNEIELKKLLKDLYKSESFELRTIPPPVQADFGIYDGKEIRLSISSKSWYAGSPDIWSNNSDVVELLKDYFEIKWATATSIKNQKKLA
jgi:sugar-specific transcriptional regulator TrmB